jgi:serine phosphatase RsbU (regulator of sigma subunit)
MWSWALQVVPFVLVAVLGGVELAVGSRWGVLSLVAVGPALAATLGGVRLVLAVGAEALVICALFAAAYPGGSDAYHRSLTAGMVVIGVSAGGCLASAARARRDRDLTKVRLVAEAAQKVVLRPLPREVGPLKLAMRYLSASDEARVGGDLYDLVSTPDCVRIVVGDAEGKGLAALQSASTVLGVFREAAHEEGSLAAIVARIESSLGREFGDEEFVTAIFAEFSADGAKMELLSCGHPDPLLLRPAGPRFLGSGQEGLPLGLGHLTSEPHSTSTIALEPGDQVLFYTDGIAEARNRAGEFFPLAECASLRAPQCPDKLVDRLCNEMNKYVGHAPDDDVALLLVSRDKHYEFR